MDIFIISYNIIEILRTSRRFWIPEAVDSVHCPQGLDGEVFRHNRTFGEAGADTVFCMKDFINQLILAGILQNHGLPIRIVENGPARFPVFRQFDIPLFPIEEAVWMVRAQVLFLLVKRRPFSIRITVEY